ncbi:hypothetical protein IU501_36200, partial [Nocardia otitidiscaviarum]|uniref:DUF6924 domain-containing protein n=1 Tax=Nocardia otitidiscaviarum TaxID=1823 RepID=UPI00397FE6BC|nr:hypothetical protein [Nocardia otitidiscaviarum]
RELPEGETLLLRTDFSDDDAWRATLDAVNRSYDLDELVDDPAFRAVTTADLEELLGSQYYLFIVDERTIRAGVAMVAVVDREQRTFRVANRSFV